MGDQITSITFGKNVQTLKEKAINNCSNLTKVKINKNLHQIDRYNRCAFVMPNYTDPIVISSNTVEIDAGSIYNVQTTSITIPRSVKDMGISLFGGSNTKLESVKLEWTWSEWFSMKFDGIFRSAIFNLQNEFFNSHPSKSTVKIYVPSQYVASYRQSGCTWLLAIGNDPSRIIGY